MVKIENQVLIGIVVTLLGWLVQQRFRLAGAQRQEQLARVNEQLRELYGPLFALASATDSAWNAFRARWRPGGAFFDPLRGPPSEAELNEWRLWVETVFMPLNRRMVELVRSRGDLLVETRMPSCLTELGAHVAAYEPVLARWSKGVFSEHTSLLNFPSATLTQYVHERFDELKRQQARLLGHS